MKRIMYIFLLLIIVEICCSFSTKAVTYTDSIPSNYSAIYSAKDLWNIQNDMSGDYILMNNIETPSEDYGEKSDKLWKNGWGFLNEFNGTFDGNGYTLYGLKLSTSPKVPNYSALFHTNNGTIKNLSLCDVNFVDANKTGEKQYIGAFVAKNDGMVYNCNLERKNNFRIGAYNDVFGGLVGYNSGSIILCSNSLPITSYASTYAQTIGGIAAINTGVICGSCNYADILSKATTPYFACVAVSGGIVGDNRGIIEQCFNAGSINAIAGSNSSIGTSVCGGIAGEQVVSEANKDKSIIKNCYNIGNIGVLSQGSFCNNGGISANIGVTDCCYTTNERLFSTTNSSDLVSNCYYDLSEEQLSNIDIFSGFDFNNIWSMSIEKGRPELQCQNKQIRPICIPPSEVTGVYGQQLNEITLYNLNENTPGKWEWIDPYIILNSEASILTQIYNARFIPDNLERYAIVENIPISIAIFPKLVVAPKIEIYPLTYEYISNPIIPNVVRVFDGDTLIPENEYSLTFKNNDCVGIATMEIKDNPGGNYTISGKANYYIVGYIKPTKIEGVTISKIDNFINITVEYNGTYMPNWNVIAAIYDKHNKLLSIEEIYTDTNKEYNNTLTFEFPECDNAEYIKIFTLDDKFCPLYLSYKFPMLSN